MKTKPTTIEPLPASGLFADRELRSFPPRIVELRRLYDEVKAAYDAANAHEDESGEEIPREVRLDFLLYERLLRREEARIASANDMDEGLRSPVSDNTTKPL